jgi:mannose-6-phosphate isomerase
MVKLNGDRRTLLSLIEEDPEGVLGEATAKKYRGRLPYLFKVLAAEKPLSIQVHPSREQARAGFRRENELGIPLDAPDRNYRDDNHKPELICALTDFWAMCGFREVRDIISLLTGVCPVGLAEEIEALQRQPDSVGLKQIYHSLLSLTQDRKRDVVEEAVQCARSSGSPEYEWLVRLADEYPGDIGVLSPLLLNLVRLRPRQAMFLPSGVLHAYLHGVGIELMANSDNVLRGGLTPKHVDVPELLKVLRFEEGAPEILVATEERGGEKIFAAPAEEFVLSVVSVKSDESYSGPGKRSIEIVLCTEGEGTIREAGREELIAFTQGSSVVIPASVKEYEIRGELSLYKAGVPL